MGEQECLCARGSALKLAAPRGGWGLLESMAARFVAVGMVPRALRVARGKTRESFPGVSRFSEDSCILSSGSQLEVPKSDYRRE